MTLLLTTTLAIGAVMGIGATYLFMVWRAERRSRVEPRHHAMAQSIDAPTTRTLRVMEGGKR